MHRWVVLLGLAACGPAAPDGDGNSADPPIAWVVAPAPVGVPLGAPHGRIGRSQAPQHLVDLGLASGAAPARSRSRSAGSGGSAARARAPDASGADAAGAGASGPVRSPGEAPASAPLTPLHLATAWPIPGDGPARAVLFGTEGDHAAIELVEVDAGRIVWRDRTACAAPVVGATADAIVCADANGTRAIGLDGRARWHTQSPFIAFTDERVVVSGAGESIILDAATGDEVARIKLPRGVSSDAILASCGDAGRELFAAGGDGRLVRVAEAKGGPAISWAVPIGEVVALHACEHDAVVVTQAGPAGAGMTLLAIARATGARLARLDGVLGTWPARDGSDRVEVATAAGVARYAADLTGAPEPLDLPPLGELIASRGDRRLVRATPLTVVVLDRAGVRGYLPLAAMGGVLGDTALLATRWTGSPAEAAHRLALPPRWTRHLRLPALRRGVALDAELRDLPPVVPVDLAAAVAQPDTGMHAVSAHALDPADAGAIYAVAVDRDGERAAVARADLAARRWRWQRTDGCGPGVPMALAVARDVVVCGTRGVAGAGSLVRATSRDGAARWDWATDVVDAVAAGGDAVIVHAADRLTVLDAGDGHVRGHLASDDGAAVRAAIVALDAATLIITADHGRVVARTSHGLLPVWSVAVAGVVRAVIASGTGVLVALEDGDAYRIDARTAAAVALPGLGLSWDAPGDLVTGQTVGGPIPGPTPPPPPLTIVQLLKRPLQILHGDLDVPPPMATPIPPPPALGDAWQLTLYEGTGGLRARNDYALAAPVAPLATRGPPGSPLVVAYGPGLHEIVVLDPRTGDPLRRVRLPDDAPPGAVFATVVAGAPVAGALLAAPLRVVVF